MKLEGLVCSLCGEVILTGEIMNTLSFSREIEMPDGSIKVLESDALTQCHEKCCPVAFKKEVKP